jgi:hypothetical protein
MHAPKPLLDYNPDKERHVDHRYMVIKATKDPNFTGVQTSKGFLKFDRNKQSFRVKDPALANEIRQTVGVDATVTRLRYPSQADRGHTYFFGQMPAMPWHKYDENGKRIIEKPKEEQPCQNTVGNLQS